MNAERANEPTAQATAESRTQSPRAKARVQCVDAKPEQQLVLSLFPGIGLLDMAFEQVGFCIVRGPDVLWGGDIRQFSPPAGCFDGVIGGPPCQAFSALARLVRANGHEPRFGNLIPEFERCVAKAEPAWFLMENVPAAPKPIIDGYGAKSFLLCNSWIAAGDGFGQEQRRVRRFTFGLRGVAEVPSLKRWIDLAVFLLPDVSVAMTSTDGGVRPSEKRGIHSPITAGHMNPDALTARRHETLIAGHDRPPGARRRVNAVLGASSMNEGCLGQTRERKQRHKAVSGSNGGAGRERNTPGAGNAGKGRYKLPDACRLQGLPEDFLSDAPLTADGKLKAVANGVPLPMGLAIARAVRDCLTESPAPPRPAANREGDG